MKVECSNVENLVHYTPEQFFREFDKEPERAEREDHLIGDINTRIEGRTDIQAQQRET